MDAPPPPFRSLGDGLVTVGLDLDNTVAQHGRAFRRYVAAEQGIAEATLPVLEDYHDPSPWGMTPEQFIQAHHRAVDDGLLLALDPMPGAIETLWAATDAGAMIRVITARFLRPGAHARVAADTATWLDAPGALGLPARGPDGRRRAIPYADLVFTRRKDHIACDLYVDDAPGNIAALRAATGDPDRVIVVDQPYNRHLGGPRIADWRADADVLLSRVERLAARR